MKNKNILVWLLVVLAVVGAVAIGYTYRGTFLQGKMGPISGPGSGPVSGWTVNDPINRAQFAKLLAVALRGDNVSAYKCKVQSFLDVGDTSWYSPYVCYLYDQDIMKGFANGTFGPANKINRAEAAKVLAHVYYVLGVNY